MRRKNRVRDAVGVVVDINVGVVDNNVGVGVVGVVVVVVVEESGNGGVEVEVVALQEEEGFFLGRGSDLAEGVDEGGIVGIGIGV